MMTTRDYLCPQCGALPGAYCRRPNGDKAITPYGSPKWHAARSRLARSSAEPTGAERA